MKKLFFAIIAFFLALGQLSFAQALLSSELAQKKRNLELSLLEDAKRTLSPQLETGSYLISIRVVLDEKKIETASGADKDLSLRSLQRKLKSEDVVKQYIETLSADDLRRFTKSTLITLTLDKEISTDLEAALVSLLENALQLNLSGSDKIKVNRVQLGSLVLRKTQEKAETLSKDLQRIEEEKRNAELKASSIETMLRSAESQSSLLKRQSEQAQEELKKQQDEVRRHQEELKRTQEELNAAREKLQETLDDKTLIGKIKNKIRGIEIVAAIVPAAILFVLTAVIVVVVIVSSSGKKTKTMNDGIRVLAEAIARSSQASNSAARTRPTKELNSENNNLPKISEHDPSDAVRAEAEAAWVLMQESLYPMLTVLKDWLAAPAGAQRFLAFSDGIGFANSRELWKHFPASEIEALSRLSPEPVPKAVAFQTVSQVCRFAEATRAAQPKFFASLDLLFLIGLTDQELAQALSACTIEAAACGLVLISPTRAARLMGLISKHNPENLVALMAKFEKLDEKTANAHLALIKKNAQGVRKEIGINITNHIAAVFENSNFNARQTISRAIAQNEPLSAALRSSVVTMDDVFSLDPDTLGELISNFEPSDLGDLVFTLNQNQRNVIAALISQRVMLGVQEHMRRIQMKPALKKRSEINGQKIQDYLREEVKRMADEGVVELQSRSRRRGEAS